MLRGIFQQLDAGAHVPLAPGSDDLNRRIERIDGEFEADLVVTLARRAMGDGIRPDLTGYGDQMLGDQRPGDGAAEQILPLIERVGPQHGEDEVAGEFLPQIDDADVFHAKHLRLRPRRLISSPWPRSAVKVTTSHP
ncbi:hypothetical protein JOH51_002736 [Rhizobium leguminosarum]|nr:hypothetical protein [Rhizobium leguminosarum]